jgi:hypothetical protein
MPDFDALDASVCKCSDSCVSGIVGGPGCTSEPAPTGGYRPPYLAARAPLLANNIGFTIWKHTVFNPAVQRWREENPALSAQRPTISYAESAQRPVEGFPSLTNRDPGDEDDGRGGGAR